VTSQLAFIVAAALANFSLGAAVLARAPRAVIHRYFALFSWAVAVWTLSNGFAVAYPDVPWRDIWPRLAFASAAVIPIAFLLLANVFPTPHPPAPRAALLALLVASCGMFLASFTSLIVRGTTTVDGTLRLIYGPLHLPFGVYFVSCLGFSLFLLKRKHRALTGSQRLQVRYLLLGVSIAATGATASNLFIPLLFHTSEFSSYGPLFSIFMIGMIAHAIIRYRLLDIRVVIRRGAVYTSAIMVVALCFFLLAELLQRLSGYGHDTIPLSDALVLALIVAISFQPLKTWMQDLLNAYFYRNKYDYQKTVREASRRLSTMLDLQPLVDYLSEVIDKTFRVETILVYLTDQTERTLTLRVPRNDPENTVRNVPLTIAPGSPLVRLVQSTQQMVVREDASREPENVGLEPAAQQLAELSGDLALPLLQQQAVIGIVVIGAKRSGDPFFRDDLDLLSTLTGQAAIAMKNAQLYQQVLIANEYVENILRTMDSGVITVNADGHVALCNSTAVRLTGLSKEHLSKLTVESLPMSLGSQLRETLADGRPRSQVETTLPGDGDRRMPLVCSTSALRDDRGKILGALVVFSDLSKIKELENEKLRAERLASFGALVSGIAHEIKNPLVAIKTFAELLPERFSDTDFREDFSKVVGTEIDRIDGLVGRLRSLAAPVLEAVGPIDIRGPILETLSLMRAQFEQTRTTVHRDLGNSLLLVAIDPTQIKQLFLNLLLNAIEAMGQGGELRISAGQKETQGQSWVSIDVADTGPGIPEAIRSRLFEPFFTTKERGSGLGLAICRSITDAHRGTISVQPTGRGQGTSLVVAFPAANAVLEPRRQRVLSA
jgi:PAS domain S-box-containing protein